jgi:hypothetical protein
VGGGRSLPKPALSKAIGKTGEPFCAAFDNRAPRGVEGGCGSIPRVPHPALPCEGIGRRTLTRRSSHAIRLAGRLQPVDSPRANLRIKGILSLCLSLADVAGLHDGTSSVLGGVTASVTVTLQQ